ncbi:PilX N-terminal domain-containing pilus assembly protein [Halomonas sp. A11-A]|nr:PilX N-terminal domain-containing pilus assembly protein [Halomonas sp. A11-A]PWV70494.1 PilX-like prepilin protein [Halomonas sp. A11-A]
MNKRLGAALVVVLALLAIALMVGLSMMQSSQVDERLAGNYRAQADAQMGAEKAACAGFGALEGPDDFVSVSLSLAELSSLGWQGFGNDAEFNG